MGNPEDIDKVKNWKGSKNRGVFITSKVEHGEIVPNVGLEFFEDVGHTVPGRIK